MPLQYLQPGPQVDAVVRSRLQAQAPRPPDELHALAGSAPAELTMESPHQVFTLGLDQLHTETQLANFTGGGWRYLLRTGELAVASAQTAVEGEGQPVFLMFNSGPFVASTAEALRQAGDIGGAAATAPLEPRLLHVPALHAMALWLHGQDPKTDVVLPLRPTPPPINPDRQYPIDEYLAALQQAASTVDAVGAEDTTGG